MRLVPRLRRLGPALLAALVLAVSLASAAHTHAVAARATALQSATTAAAFHAGADLDCALCASASRLGHGAASAPLAFGELSLQRVSAAGLSRVAPPRTPLDRSEARAPPRQG